MSFQSDRALRTDPRGPDAVAMSDGVGPDDTFGRAADGSVDRAHANSATDCWWDRDSDEPPPRTLSSRAPAEARSGRERPPAYPDH